jgi:hypothetical protein
MPIKLYVGIFLIISLVNISHADTFQETVNLIGGLNDGQKTCKEDNANNIFYGCHIEKKDIHINGGNDYPCLTTVKIEKQGDCTYLDRFPRQLTFLIQGEPPQTMVFNDTHHLSGNAYILRRKDFSPITLLKIVDSSRYINSFIKKPCRLDAKITFNLPDAIATNDKLKEMRRDAEVIIDELSLRILLHGAYVKNAIGANVLLCSTCRMIEALREAVGHIVKSEVTYDKLKEKSFDTYLIAKEILFMAQGQGAIPKNVDAWGYLLNNIKLIKSSCSDPKIVDVFLPHEKDFVNVVGETKGLGLENIKKYRELTVKLKDIQGRAKRMKAIMGEVQGDHAWVELKYD